MSWKPFKEYSDADERTYNGWAAECLRADQSEEMGRPAQAARERASADKHERWATE
jgi:hypothetical protein